MQFALNRLDEFITYDLIPTRLKIKNLQPEEKEEAILLVKRKLANIRKFLWSWLQEGQNRKQLHILILQYQTSLTYLHNQVETFQESMTENEPSKDLYLQIAPLIQDTLSFIDRHFGIWIGPERDNKDFFALFSLNEAEITALLCLLIDTQTITNHTYTSFLEFVAPLIATRKKKGLNAASMLKSKDKLTPDMRKRVKDLLLQMARELDRY